MATLKHTETIKSQPGLELSHGDGLHPVTPYQLNQSYPYQPDDHTQSFLPQNAEAYPEKRPHKRIICGMAAGTFILIAGIGLLIALAIVIGLGVGLGVGLPQASKNSVAAVASASSATASSSTASAASSGSASSTSTQSSTSASATPWQISDTWCPNDNGQNKVASSGNKYSLVCDSDIAAANKQNWASSLAPNVSICLDWCDSMNSWQGRTDISAVYNKGVGQQTPGTCWCIANASFAQGAHAVPDTMNDALIFASAG